MSYPAPLRTVTYAVTLLSRICLLGPVAASATGTSVAAQGSGSLELEKGDVICLMGNALAERMQHHGWLELRLHSRFPEHELAVRNLGFSADELSVHQRTMNFGKFTEDGMEMTLENERFVPWDRYLEHCQADVVFAFFGYNESFAGVDGLDDFQADLESFIDHVAAQSYNGRTPARLVLFSSIPHENTGDPNLPDGAERNATILRFNDKAAAVAEAKGILFIDLFAPMHGAYASNDVPLTINGIHLNEQGNRILAEVIDAALFSQASGGTPIVHDQERLRAAVLEKNLLWFNRYRTTDGYNVYGGRSRLVYEGSGTQSTFSNFEVLQREMDHLDALVANRDKEIQALARGERIAREDSNAPPLIEVATNKPGTGPAGEHPYDDGDSARNAMQLAPGMQIELFADERQFPELVNPVQMAWDTRGRLWVAVWPTYPHWRPDQPMNDKLLILEDRDGDGRADECITFAGDLHNPTGFEFWNGGVLLGSAPDLLFLKDTDGDDRADFREHLLHGLSSADTHHAANSFVLGPDGALYFQEGTFHMSQVESIYGPIRNRNGCVWRFDPRTWRVERYVPYNFANPHGHVFDRWGQDFVTDGTGNQNYYALPFSGHLPQPLKQSGYFTFFKQRSRPCGGTEILSSRHFPEENRGSYLIANVIGFRGIFQYRVEDDESGFGAVELDPIVQSTDPNFRPVDIEVGPDGALYFLDWHNTLIGHMQHHLRDPSRDSEHGRVYRVTYEGREVLQPEPIAEQPIEALLELLESPEDRVRYRARIELSARDSEEVVAAAALWLAGLDAAAPDHEHHLLEALWLHQQHNRMDRDLLVRLLNAGEPRARAAATRVLRYGRHHLPDALDLLAAQVHDDHPRVRLEAVVAASFFDSAAAQSVALEALKYPTDKFLDHALNETTRALEPHWKEALRSGDSLVSDNPTGIAFMISRVDTDELLGLPRVPSTLSAILTRHGVDAETRVAAARDLAKYKETTPTTELLASIRFVDGNPGPHSLHVLRNLAEVLLPFVGQPEGPSRDELEHLIEHGTLPETRALGFAALLSSDESPDRAWQSALASREGLQALLEGISLVADPDRRAALYERIRPIMFAPPPALADATFPGGDSKGLEVSFFEPAPRAATRAVFDELSPRVSLQASNFSLELPPARDSDSFGLSFQGSLRINEVGRYTFYVKSDDGSRLYIGDRCVVDNDGAHAMAEKRGSIELAAGAHPIWLGFFEQGGSQGLEVSWSGPGFERQPIPDDRLGSRDSSALRAAAIRAMAHLPVHEEDKLADATRLLADGALLDPTVEVLRSIPIERRPPATVLEMVETMAAYVSGLSPEQRTNPSVVAAIEVGREFASQLSAEHREAALAQLEGLSGSIILIRTLPHQMLYDLTEFWVEAGEPVAIVFQNNDVMPHNVVITAPGKMAVVGQAAELMSASPGAEARSFVPDSVDVLWNTKLVFPGQSERLTFVAPQDIGDYPFVCTYPGHWRVMNGVMRVVEERGERPLVTRRAPVKTSAPMREFVQNWNMSDLEPLLSPGWEKDRSPERGREMFTEAGCIKCHTIHGEGSIGGPELTKIREKYQGRDLLRHVLEPSAEVLDGYAFHAFKLQDGTLEAGRIIEDDGDDLHIVTALLNPEEITLIAKDEIEEQVVLAQSPMPTGLLVTLDREEVLDLLCFVQTPQEDDPTVDASGGAADDPRWVVYEGGDGPGAGKHIVLIAGDEEYRSEEALPMLGQILSVRHGFRCSVLFSSNAETGEIDPEEQTHIPGMHLLDEADMMVCFLRFRELPDDDMQHFVDFVEAGKPILGIRTSTHAFDYKRNTESPYRRYSWRNDEWLGGFGQQILGETWISHHGQHGSQSTRGVIHAASRSHPILRGVEDVWGPTDVYGVRNLGADATVLLWGQVLEGMDPDSPVLAGEKNDPMMPLVWLRELDRGDGLHQRIVCSTIGASTDCESEDLRRVFVNACYWALGLADAIPEQSRVDYVGEFNPTPFGFGRFQRGKSPADHVLD